MINYFYHMLFETLVVRRSTNSDLGQVEKKFGNCWFSRRLCFANVLKCLLRL